ncbi:hypothetical protein ACH4MJ_32195 [Streptomyces anulatus]
MRLGIVPLDAPLRLRPAGAFSIVGEQLVITEDWHAELWLVGAEAQHVIVRARRALP